MSKKASTKVQLNNRIFSVMDMKNPKAKALYTAIYVYVIILCICSAVPILWTVVSATKDIDEFYRIPPTILPQSFHPEKFLEGWKKFNFTKYYLNTFFIAMGYVVFGIISNGFMAYAPVNTPLTLRSMSRSRSVRCFILSKYLSTASR